MNKISKVMSTDASAPAPTPVTEPVQASALAPATDMTGASTQVNEKGVNDSNCIPGFVFLCNRKTKPQCFQHQVFGLPMSEKETVKKIKPGTKLFLFDYEARLLYGVYEATSEGKVNLEPTAFERRFLSQVKFKIVKECIPLPEKSFKRAIVENCEGTRFRPELSEPQVKTLISLFRPLSSSSSSSSSSNAAALPLPNAAPPQVMLTIEDQYNHTMRLHSQLQILEPEPTQRVQIIQNQQHMAGAVVDHVHPYFQHQSIPNPIDLYNAYSLELYSTGGHSQVVQEPYPRYSSGWVYNTMGLGSDYHPLPSWSMPLQQEHDAWYHQQLSLFRERETTLNGRNVAPYASVPTIDNILSSMQPNIPAYERPEPTYQVPSTYVSSTVQPHFPPSGRPVQTYSLPEDHYFSSTIQPNVPASGRPEPNYLLPTASYASSSVHPYAPASGRPEENYPLPTASYASFTFQPYASASGRPEANYPLPTDPYVSTTMRPYAPSSGWPEPNVLVSSYHSDAGADQVIR